MLLQQHAAKRRLLPSYGIASPFYLSSLTPGSLLAGVVALCGVAVRRLPLSTAVAGCLCAVWLLWALWNAGTVWPWLFLSPRPRHSAVPPSVHRPSPDDSGLAALGVGVNGAADAAEWSAVQADSGASLLPLPLHSWVAHSTLRWYANFTIHPGLFNSIPSTYSYSTADFSSLFSAYYVSPPIPRRSDGLKVALLVMSRNSADTLLFFLQHHYQAVDCVVVLDDASNDHSLPLLAEYGAELRVEVVVSKRRWVRLSEWEDRNLLLQTSRAVQATHFVMLDVDELVSYNCVQPLDDGSEPLLTTGIRQLNAQHELLRIQPVELWGNAYQQRMGMTAAVQQLAAYDQYSHLHPVPLITADDRGQLTDWPPNSLDPLSLYRQPPFIRQGKRSVGEYLSSVCCGRIELLSCCVVLG